METKNIDQATDTAQVSPDTRADNEGVPAVDREMTIAMRFDPKRTFDYRITPGYYTITGDPHLAGLLRMLVFRSGKKATPEGIENGEVTILRKAEVLAYECFYVRRKDAVLKDLKELQELGYIDLLRIAHGFVITIFLKKICKDLSIAGARMDPSRYGDAKLDLNEKYEISVPPSQSHGSSDRGTSGQDFGRGSGSSSLLVSGGGSRTATTTSAAEVLRDTGFHDVLTPKERKKIFLQAMLEIENRLSSLGLGKNQPDAQAIAKQIFRHAQRRACANKSNASLSRGDHDRIRAEWNTTLRIYEEENQKRDVVESIRVCYTPSKTCNREEETGDDAPCRISYNRPLFPEGSILTGMTRG
jgi:hypothetical protein